MSRELDAEQLERWTKEFEAEPRNRMLQNALTRTKVDDVALDHSVAVSAQRSMSHRLDKWAVTNQLKSGRCWMFAGLNLLRVGVMEKLGVKDFELSQNYTLFWDKLERCNYFLESMTQLADRSPDDRTLSWVLQDVMGDGGQWNMFASLVTKHGVVPKTVMPETESSSNTGVMNKNLRKLLRQAARDIRTAAGDADVQQIRAEVDVGCLPDPGHPPRHAAADVRVAMDRRREGVPPRRHADPGAVPRPLPDRRRH